jgi:hypothetical protein
MAATYALASAGTYTDSRTGIPARFAAGTYPLDLAVIYGMPGAAAPTVYDPLDTQIDDPADGDVLTFNAESGLWEARGASGGGGGVATIHNWFPDGAISSAALIDLTNSQDYDAHVWQAYSGTETLTRNASPAAVRIAIPDDAWDNGLTVCDWKHRYDVVAPAGRYSIGLTIRRVSSDDNKPVHLWLSPFGKDADNNDTVIQSSPVLVIVKATHRIVVPLETGAAGTIGFSLATVSLARDDATPVVAATLDISKVMITEGDPYVYADGASPGWSWSGTAHASASSGPQP